MKLYEKKDGQVVETELSEGDEAHFTPLVGTRDMFCNCLQARFRRGNKYLSILDEESEVMTIPSLSNIALAITQISFLIEIFARIRFERPGTTTEDGTVVFKVAGPRSGDGKTVLTDSEP